MQIQLGQHLLGSNQKVAAEIRRLMDEKGVFLLNLMSSPGAGKTTLLEKTLAALRDQLQVAVIEGDIATTRDADRIARQGVRAVQINTHGACHLDGAMIQGVLPAFDLDTLDLLIIENVGNLVCPAEFDLGADASVVVLSTTEGVDKVVKYPLMFREATALVLNKIDLLPFTDFSLDELAADLAQVHPGLCRFDLSARTGEGMEAWVAWLMAQVQAKRGRRAL
ncbi:hydrogenase nickel incorporation protein HypB [Heliophilum fasciatum]|uniref:Hydrogenase nickel incorporation protein HypB n=1 Tax=Heliophilum fasciatum TaxID=35700 RepID=A0A4R2RH81_9FIRM|nr:hydrogenase nickel incorporation protein HypB [Heliophilum fasciatum]MCW2278949.1 hydrogenase nickel incorporation protein HypB [Heliophilum fasciatum]TCP61799.1 hydrogenase nickel incorporation protein HypB [Heliophilum fasciatum]